ncbi:MAG: hypothetical protein LC808_03460, partial [Actinobacteria bacterium]|nr:hypothetical protein [Actinomycetota bacterium]
MGPGVVSAVPNAEGVPTVANTFVDLSRVLTGEEVLDEDLGREYEQRLQAAYPTELQALVDAFAPIAGDPAVADRLRERLDADPSLAKMARELIKIWFTSQFTGADGKTAAGPAHHWRAGLLWRVIHAPVPAAEPRTYGSW